jgi:hypothetical protein
VGSWSYRRTEEWTWSDDAGALAAEAANGKSVATKPGAGDKRDRRSVGIGALVVLSGLVFRFLGAEVLSGLGIAVKPGGFAAWGISVILSVPPLAYAIMFVVLGLTWCFWNTLQRGVPRFLGRLTNLIRSGFRERPAGRNIEKRLRAAHATLLLTIALIIALAVYMWPLERQASEGRDLEIVMKQLEAGLPPRRSLTTEQADILKSHIVTLRGHRVAIEDDGSFYPDTKQYARQFYELFRQSGLNVSYSEQFMFWVVQPPPLSVECAVLKSDSALVRSLVRNDALVLNAALVAAGLLTKVGPVLRCDTAREGRHVTLVVTSS